MQLKYGHVTLKITDDGLRHEAAQALVIRQLFIQESLEQGLLKADDLENHDSRVFPS